MVHRFTEGSVGRAASDEGQDPPFNENFGTQLAAKLDAILSPRPPMPKPALGRQPDRAGLVARVSAVRNWRAG
jgi:hypothetical protein